MPRHKQLVGSARVVLASRQRKCYHAPKHSIAKGDICLEVRDGMNWKGYCRACAEEMLQIADTKISELRQQLSRLA